MTDIPDRAPARPPEARPPEARRRFRRRSLLVAVGLVLAWLVPVTLMGLVTGYWGEPGEGRPRGVMVTLILLVIGAVVLVYLRISRPVGDLLGAAEQVTTGDYRVDVAVRGPRELRLLTATFNQMAARLAANEEQRRRFLADITHELRNPLAVLQSEIEAQMDGVHPRDDQHVASLLDETRRLGHLVDDLHTLALAETGRLVLQQEAVAFDALISAVVGRHEAQARQRGVGLRSAIAPELPKVWVDPARARQVLDNLLANAIRHTPTGGEVTVEVSRPSGDPPMVRCRVTDAGPGFREDQLAHVFDRFERAGDSGGSGLGLSIARNLVRAHGGTIEAGNDPVTGGASVGFTLPT